MRVSIRNSSKYNFNYEWIGTTMTKMCEKIK